MLIYKNKTMITKLENELQSIMVDFSKTNNNAERKQLIQEYLLASGIRFVRQNIPNTGNKNYNMCVPFGKSRNKIVVGAHVDVVEGSSGMNDNLSSVAILIVLLREIVKWNTTHSIEVVFFDEEERGRKGSKLYALREKDKVSFMINLDVCGYGEKIVYTYNNEPVLINELVKKVERNLEIVKLEALPESDDWSFNEQGLTSISIALLPQEDIDILKKCINLSELFLNIEKRKKVFEELTIVKTTHGNSLDNIQVIQYKNMCKVFEFLKMLLHEWESIVSHTE